MEGTAGRKAPGAARRRLPLSLRFMLLASLLLPLLFLAGAAWYDHRRLFAEAFADLDRLSAVAKEHALKVVETNTLVLDRIEARVHGLSWPEIESQAEAIQRDMRLLDEQIAQITSLHLADPQGQVVLLSSAWPTPPLSIASRDYFRRIAGGETGIVFGEPVLARLSGIVAFSMARRREGAGGEFVGAVIGSILPGYFQAQWRAMDPTGRAAFALVRTDGQVLALHPSGGQDLIGPPEADRVPQGIRHPSDVGPVIERLGERGEWLTAFRQVGQHPLVVSVTLSLDQVRADWLKDAGYTAAGSLLAMLALGSATLLAIRRWRSEQAVLLRLRETAEELRAEIARREAAEAGLRQAQRLEALGRLTGGVAHDFNNLLTAILGTVHLLERHLGTADDRARRLLGMARDAVDRGAKLNSSLLAFARRQRLQTATLDANALVQSFTPLIRRALGETVALCLDLDSDLPACRADAAQLEAALLNLAINARDAMPHGGTMTLATRPARLETAQLTGNPEAKPGDYVAVALRDEGTGMPPEVRDRAFEPFFTTKPMGKGTGLGLSQVFGFVRQLGGHVAIDSAPGQGTVVTLYLPAEAERPQHLTRTAPPFVEPPPEPQAIPATACATVLLAEDDERVREVTAETLRDAGFRVIAAQDGQEALALLQRGEPCDLLFSDIVMPGGLNGIELAQAARRLRPDLPVLLATGYAGPMGSGAEHGFEVVAKPYDQVALIRRIAGMAKTGALGTA